MNEKTKAQWQEEADSFAYEWEQATGRKPTLDDVISECKDIGIDNAEEYAKILFGYMI